MAVQLQNLLLRLGGTAEGFLTHQTDQFVGNSALKSSDVEEESSLCEVSVLRSATPGIWPRDALHATGTRKRTMHSNKLFDEQVVYSFLRSYSFNPVTPRSSAGLVKSMKLFMTCQFDFLKDFYHWRQTDEPLPQETKVLSIGMTLRQRSRPETTRNAERDGYMHYLCGVRKDLGTIMKTVCSQKRLENMVSSRSAHCVLFVRLPPFLCLVLVNEASFTPL